MEEQEKAVMPADKWAEWQRVVVGIARGRTLFVGDGVAWTNEGDVSRLVLNALLRRKMIAQLPGSDERGRRQYGLTPAGQTEATRLWQAQVAVLADLREADTLRLLGRREHLRFTLRGATVISVIACPFCGTSLKIRKRDEDKFYSSGLPCPCCRALHSCGRFTYRPGAR